MAQLKVDEVAAVNRVVARDRIYLNADGEPVAGDSPDAATLFAAEGDEIDRDEAVRLGLVKGAGDQRRSDTPDDSWKVADLKEYADANSIDLEGASKKDEILAAIAAADQGGE